VVLLDFDTHGIDILERGPHLEIARGEQQEFHVERVGLLDGDLQEFAPGLLVLTGLGGIEGSNRGRRRAGR